MPEEICYNSTALLITSGLNILIIVGLFTLLFYIIRLLKDSKGKNDGGLY